MKFSHQYKFEAVFVCLFFLFIAGCNESTRPEGHYEGSLLQRAGEEISQQPVSTDITYGSDGAGQFKITDIHQSSLLTIGFSKPESSGFSVSIPGVLSKTEFLSPDSSNSGCYVGSAENVHFCYTAQKFLLEVLRADQSSVFTLSGDHFSHEAHFELEKPAAYALSDAVSLALQKSFSSRIEYEHVIQAKSRAQAAELNLLPHLGLSTILANLAPDLVSILGTIGDLAPFLLPTRWLQADEAKQRAFAETDAFLLMRADLAAQVEALVYTLQRDQAILSVYQALVARATDAYSQTNKLETAGQMPAGSADHIQSVIDSMNLDTSALGLIVDEEKKAIAGTLGFHNPEAIENVTASQELDPIETAKPRDEKPLGDLVLGRSVELRQMDDLIQIARDQKSELAFNWLDPSGESLGFGIGATVTAAASQLNELLTTREQLQSQILAKLDSSVDQINQAIDAFPLMTRDLALQQRRLDRVIAQIQPGSQLNTLDVEAVFQDALAEGIRAEMIRAGYRISRAKLDRQLLQGFYVNIPVTP